VFQNYPPDIDEDVNKNKTPYNNIQNFKSGQKCLSSRYQNKRFNNNNDSIINNNDNNFIEEDINFYEQRLLSQKFGIRRINTSNVTNNKDIVISNFENSQGNPNRSKENVNYPISHKKGRNNINTINSFRKANDTSDNLTMLNHDHKTNSNSILNNFVIHHPVENRQNSICNKNNSSSINNLNNFTSNCSTSSNSKGSNENYNLDKVPIGYNNTNKLNKNNSSKSILSNNQPLATKPYSSSQNVIPKQGPNYGNIHNEQNGGNSNSLSILKKFNSYKKGLNIDLSNLSKMELNIKRFSSINVNGNIKNILEK
jgi:hypothetical protein